MSEKGLDDSRAVEDSDGDVCGAELRLLVLSATEEVAESTDFRDDLQSYFSGELDAAGVMRLSLSGDVERGMGVSRKELCQFGLSDLSGDGGVVKCGVP